MPRGRAKVFLELGTGGKIFAYFNKWRDRKPSKNSVLILSDIRWKLSERQSQNLLLPPNVKRLLHDEYVHALTHGGYEHHEPYEIARIREIKFPRNRPRRSYNVFGMHMDASKIHFRDGTLTEVAARNLFGDPNAFGDQPFQKSSEALGEIHRTLEPDGTFRIVEDRSPSLVDWKSLRAYFKRRGYFIEIETPGKLGEWNSPVTFTARKPRKLSLRKPIRLRRRAASRST